jgi:hypothetical protein
MYGGRLARQEHVAHCRQSAAHAARAIYGGRQGGAGGGVGRALLLPRLRLLLLLLRARGGLLAAGQPPARLPARLPPQCCRDASCAARSACLGLRSRSSQRARLAAAQLPRAPPRPPSLAPQPAPPPPPPRPSQPPSRAHPAAAGAAEQYDYLPFFYSREFSLAWVFYGASEGAAVHFGDMAAAKFGAYWVDGGKWVAPPRSGAA